MRELLELLANSQSKLPKYMPKLIYENRYSNSQILLSRWSQQWLNICSVNWPHAQCNMCCKVRGYWLRTLDRPSNKSLSWCAGGLATFSCESRPIRQNMNFIGMSKIRVAFRGPGILGEGMNSPRHRPKYLWVRSGEISSPRELTSKLRKSFFAILLSSKITCLLCSIQ